MSTGDATAADAAMAGTGPSGPKRHGYGPLRVLILGFVAALVIGSTGYVVSVALDPDPPIGATMCVDSSCTFAMSAGGMSMVAPAASAGTQRKHRAAPERFVRGVLSFCHLR